MKFFSEEKIGQLAFSILSSSLSVPNMDKLYRESSIEPKFRDPDILDDFFAFYNEPFMENLISFSSLIRASDDHRPYLNNFSKKLNSSIEIITTISSSRNIGGRNIREACNKIIHASEFRYTNVYTSNNPLYGNLENCSSYDTLSPQLSVIGELKKEKWEFIIHVVPFIVYAVEAFKSG